MGEAARGKGGKDVNVVVKEKKMKEKKKSDEWSDDKSRTTTFCGADGEDIIEGDEGERAPNRARDFSGFIHMVVVFLFFIVFLVLS